MTAEERAAELLAIALHAECPASGVECCWLADPSGDPACLPEHVMPFAQRLAAALSAAGCLRDDREGCHCPPCPGRGSDGHGLTHCAECCFGMGVEADPDCPTHGEHTFVARDDREGETVTAEQAWDEAAEATAEWMASYWRGNNGPPDPPRNPYATPVTPDGGDQP